MTRRPRVQFGLPAGAVNRLMLVLVGRLGLPVAGVWILELPVARGRIHAVPVIPVRRSRAEYLVAPRGHTRWVRLLIGSGHGTLRRGRRRRAVRAAPVHGREAVDALASYISANHRRNGAFFDVPIPFTREEVSRIQPRHPVIRIRDVTPSA